MRQAGVMSPDGPKPASSFVDAALGLVAMVAALSFWAAAASVEIEETHAVGNDADFDRVLMMLTAVTIVVCVAFMLLRRPIRRWRYENTRERELEEMYREQRGE